MLYIVEGEIEERFFRQMIRLYYIRPGRIKIFNIMQNELSNSDNIMMKKYDLIFCVIDSDCIQRDNLNKFCNNIKKLKTIGKVIVFVQDKNFEQELCRMLQVVDLKKFFKYRGHIKEYLAKEVEYSKIINKEKLKTYCTSPENFINWYTIGNGFVVKGYKINKGCDKCLI